MKAALFLTMIVAVLGLSVSALGSSSASPSAAVEHDVYRCIDYDGGGSFKLTIFTDMDGDRTAKIAEGNREWPVLTETIHLIALKSPGHFRLIFENSTSDEQVSFCVYEKSEHFQPIGGAATGR